MIRVSAAIILLCALCAHAQTSQDPPPAAKDCDDVKIHYAPADTNTVAKMVVEATQEKRPQGNPKRSPQGARWMQVAAPDYSKPGPWTTTIWFGENDDEPSTKITLRAHEGFNVEWLNDKLVYGSVTWSKVLSTDFVFDLETKKFIYREMEDSSELARNCE